MSLRFFFSGLHESLLTRTVSFGIPRKLSSFSLLPRTRAISVSEDSPLSALDDVLTSYVFGKKKATEVAHKVWERVVRKGDTVVDATCGNGYDTLTLLKMVSDEAREGRVYGFDVQKDALESTSLLLQRSVSSNETELVALFHECHSKMARILPEDTAVRLVAFNLGYLPGGDKAIITEPKTTIEALKAATHVLVPGGLISLVVYVGHPGVKNWKRYKSFLRSYR